VARRGHGEGTIYHRNDGRWVAQISLPNGKRKALYGKTRQEANTKRIKALRDLEQGVFAADDRQTVMQYLAAWMETMRPPRLVEEVWRDYDALIRLHILPDIGRVRLSQLSPQRVQALYATCAAKGLSARRVRAVHSILHFALKRAVRIGIVPRNVADMVDAPAVRRFDIHPLSREQARRYLEEAQTERLSALFTLALATGLRLGELTALRWSEVDLNQRKIRVVATLKWRGTVGSDAGRAPVWTEPKTRASRRQITIAAPVAEALRQHRQVQRLERLAVGPVWEEHDVVFSDEIGRPLTHDAVRWRHTRILKRAGLPTIRFHDLRHTAATLLLGQNVNPKVVSEMLGHSNITITLNIYAHVLPDMLEDAATAIAVALGW